jgi:hypothetical protein
MFTKVFNDFKHDAIDFISIQHLLEILLNFFQKIKLFVK